MSTDDDLVARLREVNESLIGDMRWHTTCRALDRIENLNKELKASIAMHEQARQLAASALEERDQAQNTLASVRGYLASDRMRWAHKGPLLEILDGTDADA